MTNKRCRHLPVVDEYGQLKGLISIGDLVKSVIEQQDQTIHFQQNYISDLYTWDKMK
jgi:CBS domain-containing protein